MPKEEFDLAGGLYSGSDIQDYFVYLKNTWRKS